MIFLRVSKLPSDHIREEYSAEEELFNLALFKDITYKIEREYPLDKHMDLSYEEFVDEVLCNYDLIDTSLSIPKVVSNLIKALVAFNFRYLKSNYYFDLENADIWRNLYSVYKDKNSDYLDSAEKQMKMRGIESFRTRLEDKISRLYAFSVQDMNVDEKQTDTIEDLIGYCMIFLIWYEKDMPRYE